MCLYIYVSGRTYNLYMRMLIKKKKEKKKKRKKKKKKKGKSLYVCFYIIMFTHIYIPINTYVCIKVCMH